MKKTNLKNGKLNYLCRFSLFSHFFTCRPHIFGPLIEDKFPKLISLDKMITLIVYLLEKTHMKDSMILSQHDFDSLISGKTFNFLQQQIRDNINLRQTFNLICTLYRLDETLAPPIINTIFNSIIRASENSAPFFKILSFITENAVFAHFSKLILPKIWEVAQNNSLQTLDWLLQHVPRNKLIHDHVLSTLDQWVVCYLLEDNNLRVRSATALLICALVPSPENSFRQNYRPFRPFPYTINKDLNLSLESISIIDKLLAYLMNSIKKLKNFTVNQPYGVQKVTNYFFIMAYLFVNSSQKRLFVVHFTEFWNFFQNKLAEPAISVHQNKQAFLMFWYLACQEYPESIKCIVGNPQVYKKIAFNYILADHEDQETIQHNKNMLPYYYGILRLCCQASRPFTRYLAVHQNIQWAFQNISPYANHYQSAVQELFKLMRLFATTYPDSTEEEIKDVVAFKRNTLKMYLNTLSANMHWATLLNVLNILIESDDDLTFIIHNNGLYLMFMSFNSLCVMFHEATACHINNEIVDVLRIISSLLQVLETAAEKGEMCDRRAQLKDFVDFKRLIFLMNTYTPATVRDMVYEVLGRLVRILPNDFLRNTAHVLAKEHNTWAEHNCPFVNGPYFPKRGQKMFQSKSSLRPSRPCYQMCFNPSILESSPVRDLEYEKLVFEYFEPFHIFVEEMTRFAVKQNLLFGHELVELTTRLADESLYFRSPRFLKLWLNVHNQSEELDCSDEFFRHLLKAKGFKDYCTRILARDRLILTNDQVYEFMSIYLVKVRTLYDESFTYENAFDRLTCLSSFCLLDLQARDNSSAN